MTLTKPPVRLRHAFERNLQIRFSHCDPAGIVFFPQYLVMFVDLVEDWFTSALGHPYSLVFGPMRMGLPTTQLNVRFTAPSRLGDEVTLGLSVERVGRSSIALALGCRSGDEARVQVEQVLVTTSLDTHKAISIPTHVREALDAFVAAQSPVINGQGAIS